MAVEMPTEEELVILRRHSIFLLLPFSIVLLGLAVVGLVFWLGGASAVFSIVFFLWLIVGGGFAFYYWYRWNMNRYTFTSKRVIVREQISLFKRISAEIRLDEIIDITYQINGIWGTLFNFGDIFLEGEGREPLVLIDVFRPGQIQEELFELRDKALKDKEMTAEELVETVQDSSKIREQKKK